MGEAGKCRSCRYRICNLSGRETGDANNLSRTSKEPIIMKVTLKEVTIFALQSSLPRQNWDNPLNYLRKLVKQIDVPFLLELSNS
jgi:hypothetical protein